MAERKFSPDEANLFRVLRTEPKEIKSRQLVKDPATTPRSENPFYIAHRDGAVLNFPKEPNEFYLVSHEVDWREGRELKPPSGIYWDFRSPNDNLLKAMGIVLARVPLDVQPQYCAGIPTTGGKIASVYAEYAPGVTYLDLFQKIEKDGGTTIVEADNAPQGHGEPLVLIDDVLSKGTSALPAFGAAKRLGFEPRLLVVIDRQQGGVARLAKAGYKVFAWCNVEEALDYYLNQAPQEICISQEQYDSALESLRQDQFSG